MTQTKAFLWGKAFSPRWLVFIAFGALLVGWGLNAPEGVLGKADAIGYAVCHRIALRSFYIGDRPMPLCARCSGMYLGALTGIIYQHIVGRRRTGFPGLPVLVTLLLFLGLFALDGGNSYFALFAGHGLLYEPSNVLRLFTGTGMGLVIAVAIYPVFNQTVWRDGQDASVFNSYLAFFGMVVLAVLVDLLLLMQNPVLLYILAIASAGAVVLILSMVYGMVFLIVTRQENRFVSLPDLVFPLIVGMGVGLFQIALLDLVRFWLTGTWEGFHFG